MRAWKLITLVVALCIAVTACNRRPKAPDGNELTESGNEIPKPVDDSIIDKENVDPPKPNVK